MTRHCGGPHRNSMWYEKCYPLIKPAVRAGGIRPIKLATPVLPSTPSRATPPGARSAPVWSLSDRNPSPETLGVFHHAANPARACRQRKRDGNPAAGAECTQEGGGRHPATGRLDRRRGEGGGRLQRGRRVERADGGRAGAIEPGRRQG